MSVTYKITIYNSSNAPRVFSIFNEQPILNNAASLWSNIYIQTPHVPNNSPKTLSFTDELFVWSGLAPSSPSPGVELSGGQSLSLRLGTSTRAGSTYKLELDPVDSTPTLTETTSKAPNGMFSIETGNYAWSPDSTALVGMSKKAPGSFFPLPVSTFNAQPNTTYTIIPKKKFWIAEGEFTPGQIIDVSAIGSTYMVDFTSATAVKDVVIQFTDSKTYIDITKTGPILNPEAALTPLPQVNIRDALKTVGYFLHGLQSLTDSLIMMADSLEIGTKDIDDEPSGVHNTIDDSTSVN